MRYTNVFGIKLMSEKPYICTKWKFCFLSKLMTVLLGTNGILKIRMETYSTMNKLIIVNNSVSGSGM